MHEPSALSPLSYPVFFGALIFFVGAPQAAGQNPEPKKIQTENVRPQSYFKAGEPSGLRVEQWGSGMGTNLSFLKGADLLAAPQQQIHSPGEPQTLATVPAMIFPPMPNFAKFAQTVPSPAFKTSNSFDVQAGQTADAVIPNRSNALPLQIPPLQDLCSVPLLRVQPDPNINFTIRLAPVAPIDSAMVLKPMAPSCLGAKRREPSWQVLINEPTVGLPYARAGSQQKNLSMAIIR
ncbi:MAG: hypothetical protein WAO35_25630 [Terriglobia bacterium]